MTRAVEQRYEQASQLTAEDRAELAGLLLGTRRYVFPKYPFSLIYFVE